MNIIEKGHKLRNNVVMASNLQIVIFHKKKKKFKSNQIKSKSKFRDKILNTKISLKFCLQKENDNSNVLYVSAW